MSLGSFFGGVLKAGLGVATGGVSDKVFDLVKGGPKPGKPVSPALILPQSSGGMTNGIQIDSVVTRGVGMTAGRGGVSISGGRTTTYNSRAQTLPELTSTGRVRKKIRRMNALNPKALSRSIRRVGKFADFAKSIGFSRAPSRLKGIHAPKRKRSCR